MKFACCFEQLVVCEMSAKSEPHLVGTVQNRVLSQLHPQQSSFGQIQRTDSHKLPSYLIGHKAVRSLSSKQDKRKVCKSSGVLTFVFTLKNRKIKKCAFNIIQHTSWLVLLAAFCFRWLPVLPIVARHWTKSSRYAGPHCCNAAKVEDWKPSRKLGSWRKLLHEILRGAI